MQGTTIRRAIALAVAAALVVPALALGTNGTRSGYERGGDDFGDARRGDVFATDNQGNLLQFNMRNTRRVRAKAITGLPPGVTLKGIDFRPATGDLYGVGSNNVVYRVNTHTAIAFAEGPSFTTPLRGTSFGVDFNPVVDKIRVVSDANQNLRLNPDDGTLLSADKDLNPGDPNVVGAGYTNSSFSATRPAATMLNVVDSNTDTLFLQNPPNDGTLVNPRPLDVEVSRDASFDIAGVDDVGYLISRSAETRGTALHSVNVANGRTRLVGRVGNGDVRVTGLAVWQDQL